MKQYYRVKYLGCVLDENLSRDPMAFQTIKKINTRFQFLHTKNRILPKHLCRLTCNAII